MKVYKGMTTELQREIFLILCARKFISKRGSWGKEWHKWASDYLSGKDRRPGIASELCVRSLTDKKCHKTMGYGMGTTVLDDIASELSSAGLDTEIDEIIMDYDLKKSSLNLPKLAKEALAYK